MTTVGIVAEYNPLHLGHVKQYHMIRSRFGADTAIVCVMSGNYVQRGQPAIFDKRTRAEVAVRCGADLVVELPITRSISSAEGFAYGAVEILDRMGVVDAVCFGSEHGHEADLLQTARHLLDPAFDEAVRQALRQGGSYAAARVAALESLGADGALLRRPNDILAVEYCKALLRLQSAMTPVAVTRQGDYHSALADAENPSATAVRRLLLAGQSWEPYVPPAAAAVFAGSPLHYLEYGERAMLARLRSLSDAEFEALPFGAEGLWSKVMKACRSEATVEGILDASKSKRYARARLMRMLLCGYLGVSREMLEKTPQSVRALAFSSRGAGLLRRAREVGRIGVQNAGQADPDPAYAALERRAADLYTLFRAGDCEAPCGMQRAERVFFLERGGNS